MTISVSIKKTSSKTKKSIKESSGIHRIKARMTTVIPPVFAQNVESGVRHFLNSMIMRYSEELDGIVLLFLDYRPLQSTGLISFDAPHISIEIEVTFLVYRPVINSMEWGVVNKVSPDHVGLLVLGIFNGSVPAADLRERGWKWNAESAGWVAPDGSSDPDMKPGAAFQFVVTSLLSESGSVFLGGRIPKKMISSEPTQSSDKKRRKTS